MKSFRTSVGCGLLVSALTLGAVGCNTAPKSETAREELTSDAMKALNRMQREDPSLQSLLNSAYGYAIFPDVGQGAIGVGGAHGHGEVYRNNDLVGYSELSLVNVGIQAGGQKYAELIVFKTQSAFENFTNNHLTFEAAASAVILKSGAGAEAKWHNDIAVFKQPEAGAMFEAAIGGQRFTYKSISAVPPPTNSGT